LLLRFLPKCYILVMSHFLLIVVVAPLHPPRLLSWGVLFFIYVSRCGTTGTRLLYPYWSHAIDGHNSGDGSQAVFAWYGNTRKSRPFLSGVRIYANGLSGGNIPDTSADAATLPLKPVLKYQGCIS